MERSQLQAVMDHAVLIMSLPRALSDPAGRDLADQELTSILATLAEEEATLEQEAEQVQLKRMAKGDSATASEVYKKSSDSYKLYKQAKLLREAIVEHIRGLRSHAKREFTERTINE